MLGQAMRAFFAVLDKVTLADLLAEPQSVVAMPTSRRLATTHGVPGLPDKVA
jgi:hypothetical protein